MPQTVYSVPQNLAKLLTFTFTSTETPYDDGMLARTIHENWCKVQPNLILSQMKANGVK